MKKNPPPPQEGTSWNLKAFDSKEFSGTIESRVKIEPRSIRFDAKQDLQTRMRRETAEAFLGDIPAAGVTQHFISNGNFDYWDCIALLAKKLGPCHFHGSTWTMNRRNVQELLSMFDKGEFLSICLITGIYFKRRETAVYAQVAAGLLNRGQKFRALETHAKVALLTDTETFLSFEGSANFTANPRIENNTLTNSQELHTFHRSWIEEAATAKD